MQKFYTIIGNNPDLSRLIQAKCFEKGFKWPGHDATPQYLYAEALFIDEYWLSFSHASYAKGTNHKEVTVPEFLEFLKNYQPPVKISLNSEYTAEIKGNVVRVGCQTIEFGPILELADQIRAIQQQSMLKASVLAPASGNGCSDTPQPPQNLVAGAGPGGSSW